MPAPSLLDRLAGLTDPRSRHGRQYPLVPMLALCLVATLAGCTSVAAIAQFGRLRRHRLGHALGFHHGKMPAANTITDLLAALDPDHLDRVTGDWLADRHADGWDHIALDGKVLRGSRDGDAPGVHLLAAYAPQASAVIARMTVEATTNEHKTALRPLGVLPLAGAVVTADAMFSHADVCEKILEKHGDYVLYAKDNRSQLKADIEAAFAAAEGGDFPPSLLTAWLADAVAVTSRCQGHGRIERRTLTTTTWLNEYLRDAGWPQVSQAFRLVRERTADGATTVEVVSGITSGGRVTLDGERLLAVTRDHWGIENGLHHTRDETFREDRCRVRRGNAPRVLASLRNVAVYLLRNTDHPSVPAATREMAAFPDRALDLLTAPTSISE